MLRKFALFFIVFATLTGAASAQSLDALRASGAVGERFDGLAVARDPAAAGVVEEVNRQRLEIYRARAAEQGVTVQQVGQVYAREIMQRAPAGTWQLDSAGRWRQ